MNRRQAIKSFPSRSAPGKLENFASVKDEMHHYLYELGVDGMFTDNPDQFPRTK